MIELHRPPASPAADEIAAALQNLVVAFRVVENEALERPEIRDGEQVHGSSEAIAVFLEQLRRDVNAWNAFQSDSCYIGDDGRVC